VNTHIIQSLKVCLKCVLPWLKYDFFSRGLFLLAHPVYSFKLFVYVGSCVWNLSSQIIIFVPVLFCLILLIRFIDNVAVVSNIHVILVYLTAENFTAAFELRWVLFVCYDDMLY